MNDKQKMFRKARRKAIFLLAFICVLGTSSCGKGDNKNIGKSKPLIFPVQKLDIDLAATGCKVDDYKRVTESKNNPFKDMFNPKRSAFGYQIKAPEKLLGKDGTASENCRTCDDLTFKYYWPSYQGWLDYSKKPNDDEGFIYWVIDNHLNEVATTNMEQFFYFNNESVLIGRADSGNNRRGYCNKIILNDLDLIGCLTEANAEGAHYFHYPLDAALRSPSGQSVPTIKCALKETGKAPPGKNTCYLDYGITKDGLHSRIMFPAAILPQWKSLYCESVAILKISGE